MLTCVYDDENSMEAVMAELGDLQQDAEEDVDFQFEGISLSLQS